MREPWYTTFRLISLLVGLGVGTLIFGWFATSLIAQIVVFALIFATGLTFGWGFDRLVSALWGHPRTRE